jgi:hypothetical protein
MINRTGILMTVGVGLAVSTCAWAYDADVRAVHASPGAPAVDVLLDGAPAFVNVAYTDVTEYAPVEGGQYIVKVVPTGQVEPVYIEEELGFAPYLRYTVAAAGEPADIEPLVLLDALLVFPGQSMLRFVHLSPNAGELDLEIAGGDALFEEVAFKQTHEYAHLDAGAYDLEIRDSDSGDVLLAVPGVMLDPGTASTLFLFGLEGGTPALEASLVVDLVTCMGDVVPDGDVNCLDLLLVLATWGDCPPDTGCLADVNGDGVVDVEDLLAVLAAWGPCA